MSGKPWMRRIAVWNTAFLGDALLTLPLAQSLRLRYPDAAIDFYCRRGVEPLFMPHPALNAVFGFDKRGAQSGPMGMLDLCRDVGGRSYDLWVSAHSSPRSGMAALASRAAMRIGYASGALSRFFYTDLVDRRFAELDEIERLLALLGPLGPHGRDALSDWPELALAPEAAAGARAFFDGLAAPVLGLHPGSVWATKRWPAGHFADIGAKAIASGAEVILFAGPGEEAIAQNVRARILSAGVYRGKLHDFSGRLSLPELAAYLAHVSCYLGNDSGPLHMAWAQHRPVTAIFGPTVREHGFYPRGKSSTVFERPEPCRPCGLHGHKVCPLGHHNCMVKISPDMVWPDVAAKLWP